ncbi:MAG: APC family permease, partial [Candidatus Korarchaeota archaeon]|nr:APC family permease [Candidatus Korarchaeota archaeon]
IVVVAVFVAINFFGSKTVGRTESFIVLGKLLVLGIFVLGGLWTINPDYVAPQLDSKHVMGAVYAATIFFLSYTGFGLITNASEDIEDPEKNVPRAIYLSLLIVTLVYVSISVVAVGNLPVEELIKAKEYALAEAAKPFLGSLGFTFISVGALFSTSSAINATTFLLVYIFAILSHLKLIDETRASKSLVAFSLVMVLAIFSLLMYYQWRTDQRVFYTIWINVLAFASIELAYRRLTKRGFLAKQQIMSKYEVE